MTKKVKLRTLWIGGLFTLFFIVLIGKMYMVQIVDASELIKKAQEMWERNRTIQPVRGMIVDRHSQVLAEDGPSYTVVLNPKIIDSLKNGREIVKPLSAILGKPEAELLELMAKKKEDGTLSTWVEVRSEGWKIDVETADKIATELKLTMPINSQSNLYTHGVYLEESPKRYYPGGSLAAHVLGYFDKNGKAVMGLEAAYDDLLKGKPGYIVTEKDRMGYELPDAKASYEPAEDGKTLQLTIDRNIQSYLETAMERSFAEFKPKSLTAIAMDPKTGEILGLANMPTFNPSKYWDAKPEAFRNTAISSQFEPGSTFKLVTLAGTVEEGLFDPNDRFKSGSIKIYDRTLKDHNNGAGWGTITYLEGLKRSSNVAFVKLGYEKLKPDNFVKYINKFGFGQKTGIDLPGEVKGLVRFNYPVDYATATYGQGGVSVTAIQQIAAYGAVANGGKMMQPHVVKAILDPKTNEPVQTFEPQMVSQVVSPQTASKVTEYLEQVVSGEFGTGKNAAIEGYRVAGKTGTANIVINGKYSEDQWVITFVGYAPVEDPKIVVLVQADQPDLHGNYHNGGLVAPVVFKEIMSQSLRYMNVKATVTQELSGVEKKLTAPDLSGRTVADAKKELGNLKLKYDLLGKGASVIAQLPAGGTEIGQNQRIYLLTEEKEGVDLPNLQGKSLRDALAICSFMKADCQVSGEGYVAAQTIVPSEDQMKVSLQLVPWNDLEKAKAEAAKVALQNQQTAGKSPQNGNGQTGATRTPSGTPPKTKP
ncbi:penicillin-binding transpeptidase domain-containing protein [Paenibacillus ginsengarvi]|uniref:PASTA domain-containing protein n=1 Tax=Paenibacillus ginsengarvi TaxID=400777 RepID=A0A3B0CZH6_9BACL|nr:penicillin-binding transpeptidase domain-containing protein [Paenibacillus ginsengarvi]RKN86896.1 PASTA domain-containing protein [Paenibacillus ginsengarvi]